MLKVYHLCFTAQRGTKVRKNVTSAVTATHEIDAGKDVIHGHVKPGWHVRDLCVISVEEYVGPGNIPGIDYDDLDPC